MIDMKTLDKPANTTYDIVSNIRDRWSPRAFTDEPISKQVLGSLLESVRWAPSSMNEQPWRLIYAHKGSDGFEKISETLMEGNSWAKEAPLLMLTFAKTTFDRNGKTNRTAHHDLGIAMGQMGIQATDMGISLHQMGGIHLEKVKNLFHLPDNIEPVAAVAIGYVGDPDSLGDELKSRELAQRKRLAIEDFAFENAWK